MKKIVFFCFVKVLFISVFAQNMDYTNQIILELSSQKYFGRGYVNKGDSLAADFLAGEFEKMKLQKYNDSYFQTYYTNINRYIQKPIMFLDDKELVVTKDFISIPDSKELEGKYKIEWIRADELKHPRALKHFLKQDYSNSFICIDTTGLDNDELFTFANTIFSENYIDAAGIIETTPRLKYTARTNIKDFVHLQVKPESINYQADSVYVKIDNDFIENYQTRNVVSFIKGKSDSIVMFTAHYDHLGMIGDIMYPGANDNASGVSMVLNLAKHFSEKRKPEFTMVFALFSGEEAGLLGSRYMAENSLFDLDKVKFLVNFDMVGTGDDGIYMLNAKEYPVLDSLMIKMNQENKYFELMRSSNATYSSDHAPFYDKGVDAVFIYAAGNNDNYHQPQDKIEDLTYFEYKDIFRFCLDLIEKYAK